MKTFIQLFIVLVLVLIGVGLITILGRNQEKNTFMNQCMMEKTYEACEQDFFMKRTENNVPSNMQTLEYNDMYNSLVQEGYIVMKPVTGGGEMPSVANPLADNLYGWWGLSEAILTKYKASWTILIIPLLFGMWGSPYLKNIWNLIFK